MSSYEFGPKKAASGEFPGLVKRELQELSGLTSSDLHAHVKGGNSQLVRRVLVVVVGVVRAFHAPA